jgi:two-component system OmpR family sensor kinase
VIRVHRRGRGARRSWAGRLSSRQRLTLQIAAALLVLWAVIGWISVWAVERRLYDDIDEELTADIPQVAAALEVLSDDELRELTSQDRAGGDTALLIVGPAGVELFLPSGPAGRPDAAPDLGAATTSELRGRAGEPFTVDAVDGPRRYRIVTSPLDDGRVVVRARPLDEVGETVEDVRAVTYVAFVGTVVGAAGLVWVISRQTFRPLEDVITSARDVGAGSLDARVAVTSTAPDVVRLADALNVMLDRLEEAFTRRQRSEERLRQFVSDASHELRTPLAAVIGFAELYQQHAERAAATPPDEARDRMVARMLGEANRMQLLVEELLTLARLDEGRALARDDVELSALVADAVAAVRVTTGTHRFELAAGERVTVTGDRHALRQVVDNLLNNTVAHTPDGSTTRVSLRVDDGVVALEVADDGPGLPADEAARAFDRFWRATPDRSRPGGSGLGLAIVAEIARAHGGTAAMTATPGRGCTVVVRLPRGKGERAPAAP